jgi:hypothetical protein
MDAFKTELLKLIQDDEMNMEDANIIFSQFTKNEDNATFMTQLTNVVQILTTDRDGDGSFTIDDLTLIKNDIPTIHSIIKGCVILVNSIKDKRIHVDQEMMGLSVMKLLAYIFLVLVPTKLDQSFTRSEKESIVDIVMLMYTMFSTSEQMTEWVNGFTELFSKKKCCKCCCKSAQPEVTDDVLNEHMDKMNAEIHESLTKLKTP